MVELKSPHTVLSCQINCFKEMLSTTIANVMKGNGRTSPVITEILYVRLQEKIVLKFAVNAVNPYKYFPIAYATSSLASTHVCFSYLQIRRLFTLTYLLHGAESFLRS